MQNPKPILLIITGHTIEPVRSQFGDTDAHFAAVIGEGTVLHGYAICDVWPAQPLPMLSNYGAVIMTGSAAMLADNQPWMKAAKDLVAECLREEVPFLGVCFGHQVLGAVCGAQVGPNPQGRANGTRTVEVLEQSPIFEMLPSCFAAQISHRDVILEDRPEFKVIAKAPHDERHAISVGKCAFGVQFHPEWNMDLSSAYIDARQEILGAKTAAAMAATLAPSPMADQIVRNFLHEAAAKGQG